MREFVTRLEASRDCPTSSPVLRVRAVEPDDVTISSELLQSVEALTRALLESVPQPGVSIEMWLVPLGPDRLRMEFSVALIERGGAEAASRRIGAALVAISSALLARGIDADVRQKADVGGGAITIEVEDAVTEPRVPRRARFP